MKNDWRLTNQIDYLFGKTLIQVPCTPYSETWTHDHCEFCSETIDETTKDAYCTEDKYHWICKDCFKDFKEMFDWRTKEIN